MENGEWKMGNGEWKMGNNMLRYYPFSIFHYSPKTSNAARSSHYSSIG